MRSRGLTLDWNPTWPCKNHQTWILIVFILFFAFQTKPLLVYWLSAANQPEISWFCRTSVTGPTPRPTMPARYYVQTMNHIDQHILMLPGLLTRNMVHNAAQIRLAKKALGQIQGYRWPLETPSSPLVLHWALPAFLLRLASAVIAKEDKTRKRAISHSCPGRALSGSCN